MEFEVRNIIASDDIEEGDFDKVMDFIKINAVYTNNYTPYEFKKKLDK